VFGWVGDKPEQEEVLAAGESSDAVCERCGGRRRRREGDWGKRGEEIHSVDIIGMG